VESPTSTHALSHSCLPLSNFLITSNPTFFFVICGILAFFAIAWPKQKLAKGCSSCKGAHITIDDNVVVKLLRLELSSLTFE